MAYARSLLELAADLATIEPTVLASVPRVYEQACARIDRLLKGKGRRARALFGLGVPLVQGYGLTETSPIVTANLLHDNVPESVGRPLPGVEVRLGERDELLVRGPGVMLGYWENPEATRRAIDPQGWFHTGDQARIENARVCIVGRIKEVLVPRTIEDGSITPTLKLERTELGRRFAEAIESPYPLR